MKSASLAHFTWVVMVDCKMAGCAWDVPSIAACGISSVAEPPTTLVVRCLDEHLSRPRPPAALLTDASTAQ